MVSEKCPVVAMDQYTENLSGFLAMSALEEIWLQTLLLGMPSVVTSQTSSSPSQT